MRLLAVGDNVVDRYRDLGLMFPGGNALNVAVAARRAGADTAYVGALGTDAAGRAVLEALRAEEVGLDRLRVVEGPNAYALVELVDGNRHFVGGDIGVSRFVLDDADLAYAASFDLAHTGDCSMIEDQVDELAGRVPVSFDFSVKHDPAYAEPMLPHLSVAFFSASELDDGATAELLRWAVRRGTRVAVATRGTAPTISWDGRELASAAVAPAQVVDTLGAGDAFIGRYLVGWLAGESARALLEAASQAAARTCEHLGAFGRGIPDLAPLEEVVRSASH